MGYERTRRLFLLSGLITLGLVFSFKTWAQSGIDNEESAQVFVQNFYNGYVKLMHGWETRDTSPLYIVLKGKENYFNDEFRKAILHDIKVQSISPGVVGISLGPAFNLENIDSLNEYRVVRTRQVEKDFYVYVNLLKKKETTKSTLEPDWIFIVTVTRERGHWLIVDILYPSGDGPTSLLWGLENTAVQKGKQ